MGLDLPGALASLLQMLGYNWPKGDESKLFEIGQKWMSFSSTLTNAANSGQQVAQQVWAQNKGQNIQKFEDHIQHADGPIKVLQNASTAATLTGAGMTVCAGIILALKTSVITQLSILAVQIAQAIASAIATFGASLAEIPIFEQISQRLIDMLLNQVITKLLNA